MWRLCSVIVLAFNKYQNGFTDFESEDDYDTILLKNNFNLNFSENIFFKCQKLWWRTFFKFILKCSEKKFTDILFLIMTHFKDNVLKLWWRYYILEYKIGIKTVYSNAFISKLEMVKFFLSGYSIESWSTLILKPNVSFLYKILILSGTFGLKITYSLFCIY